jgi:hypothetical protein
VPAVEYNAMADGQTYIPNTQRGPDTNNPERAFTSPLEVVHHRQLTWGMKLHSLDCWRLCIEDRLLARAENSFEASKRDLQLISEIEQARELVLGGPSWSREVWRP